MTADYMAMFSLHHDGLSDPHTNAIHGILIMEEL